MIHRELRDGITVLRMEHGKVNAVDTDLCNELLAHLKQDATAIVLTGTGTTFSAGVDLIKVLDGGTDYIRGFLDALTRALEALFEHPRPVVAAINGHAIAGGCILACACDHRIMSEGQSRIGVPELQVGVPFPALAFEIMRLAVPSQHLKSVLYSGRTVVPELALSVGLIDETAKPEELLDRACAVASKLAAIPARAFEITKRQLRGATAAGLKNDEQILQTWTAPETHEEIRRYLDRTLRKK